MGANGGTPLAKQQQQQQAMSQSPPFNMFGPASAHLSKKLEDILDCFYGSSKDEALDAKDSNWPEAQGPSYHEVLGQVNPAIAVPPIANIGAQPMAAPWQQQQQ